jgi:hypothetical protein
VAIACRLRVKGEELPEAYCRVVQFAGGPKKVAYRVAIYTDEKARIAGTPPIEVRVFQGETSEAEAVIASLYTCLKARPEFAVNCVDKLEPLPGQAKEEPEGGGDPAEGAGEPVNP